MAKMIGLSVIFLLTTVLLQVEAVESELLVNQNEVLINDNGTTDEAQERLLLSNFLRTTCMALVNKPSSVLPNIAVTLTRLANGRVYFFAPASAATTFANALTFCRNHGMHLVTINSDRENTLVLARLKTLGVAGVADGIGAWIGLRDISASTWRWTQNNAPPNFWYFKAAPTAGQCALYDKVAVTDPTKAWIDLACTTATPTFVCEMEPLCSQLVPAIQA